MIFTPPPPLSLYIHIPWCVRKCPYCDFNSHQARGTLPEMDYIKSLLMDLEQHLPAIEGREIISIFLGGGTPSLLSPEALEHLFTGLRARLPLAPEIEITLESNPGTVSLENLRAYRRLGINRLSIGVQSLRDPMLQFLGRIHGRQEALAAFEFARAAGFDNINLDLMFGLPEDNEEGCLSDLRTAIELGPEHLSWYQLTLEPNTLFYRHPPPLPGEDVIFSMHQQGQGLLAEYGYAHYEVSAYARDAHFCRHNRNYWEFGDYVGIGAGAHGKITDPATGQIVRIAKRKQPREYIEWAGAAKSIADRHILDAGQAVVEFMMNALRLQQGFPASLFEQRTGLSLSLIEPTLAEAQQQGMLHYDANFIRPTELGHRYLNELVYLFYQNEPLFTAPLSANQRG
jgi:oxygen-independent coproporphyrinogen-3 oxidase